MKMPLIPRLAIVLPCYNEAKNLTEILIRFFDVATRHGFDSSSFRLILVNNGSTDDTDAVLADFAAQHPNLASWFVVVRVPVNRGYGAGLNAGLNAAEAQFVGWTHADGQCPPEDVFRAYRVAVSEEGILCMGRRVGRSWAAWAFSRAFDATVWLVLRKALFDINAQPKVFPAMLASQLGDTPNGFAFDLHVLLRAKQTGLRIRSIPVQFADRRYGQSSWATSLESRMKTIRAMLSFVFSQSASRLVRKISKNLETSHV